MDTITIENFLTEDELCLRMKQMYPHFPEEWYRERASKHFNRIKKLQSYISQELNNRCRQTLKSPTRQVTSTSTLCTPIKKLPISKRTEKGTLLSDGCRSYIETNSFLLEDVDISFNLSTGAENFTAYNVNDQTGIASPVVTIPLVRERTDAMDISSSEDKQISREREQMSQAFKRMNIIIHQDSDITPSYRHIHLETDNVPAPFTPEQDGYTTPKSKRKVTFGKAYDVVCGSAENAKVESTHHVLN